MAEEKVVTNSGVAVSREVIERTLEVSGLNFILDWWKATLTFADNSQWQ